MPWVIVADNGWRRQLNLERRRGGRGVLTIALGVELKNCRVVNEAGDLE